MNVVLDVDKVEFAPTLKQLAHVVNSISGHLTDSISDVKRLPELLSKRKVSKKVGIQKSFNSRHSAMKFFVVSH